MQTSLQSAIAYAALGSLVAAPLGCGGDWLKQHEVHDDASVPAQPDASTHCLTVTPFEPSSSAQVNGGLCYGLAVDATETLTCAPAGAPNVTECADPLLGLSYVVVWSGNSGTVRASLDGSQVGTVSQQGASAFAVTTSAPLQATCSIEPGPPAQAVFCSDALAQ